MAAPVILTEEYGPRDITAFPEGQQSCDTADPWLSAPATRQAPSWGGQPPTTTQQEIFQDSPYQQHRRLRDLKKKLY